MISSPEISFTSLFVSSALISLFSLGFSWSSKLSKYSFHQQLPSFTLDYSYLLYIFALSVFLLCYLEQLIFPLLRFQVFFVQFLVCLVFCLCHFSLSLFSCSFIGQLACIISDGIPYLFSFSLVLQFFLDFLVLPSRLPATC